MLAGGSRSATHPACLPPSSEWARDRPADQSSAVSRRNAVPLCLLWQTECRLVPGGEKASQKNHRQVASLAFEIAVEKDA